MPTTTVAYAKFNNTLTVITLFVYGILLISYVFYIRLIIQRLPRDLTMIVNGEFNYLLFSIVFTQTIVALSIIYASSKRLFTLPDTSLKVTNQLYTYLSLQVQKFIGITYEALAIVFSKCIHLITEKPFFVMEPFITKFFNIFGSSLYIFVVIQQVIKFILLTAFFIDIFSYFEYYYFYKNLSLLIIILIINAWFSNIEEWLQLAQKTENKFMSVIEKEKTKYYNVYKLNSDDFQTTIRIYIKYVTYNRQIVSYKELREFWNVRINLIYYSLMLIGCLSIYYLNLESFVL